MNDYGSGTLGSWTSASKSISVDTQIIPAVERGAWVFGDSILVADGRDLASRLAASMGLPMAVNAWSSRPTAPAVDVLQDWVCSYGSPPVLVMATGANDIFNPFVMASEIARVMSIVESNTEVFWVNVYVDRWSQPAGVRIADIRNSGLINAQLARAEGQYEKLTVIQWMEFLAEYPGYRPGTYLRDGVHTSLSGQAARNALIVSAVKSRI